MRRAVEFLVDMLPLDAAGQRAVDETMADWRHEEGEARSSFERVCVAFRGVWSLAVALAYAIGRDLFSAATARTCMWCLALAAAFGVVMPFAWIFTGPWRPLPIGLRFEMLGLLAPWAITTTLPLALLALTSIGRRTSVVTACVWLCVLSFVTLGWVLPETNQAFRERAALHNNPQPRGRIPPELPRGEAELSLPVLLSRAGEDTWLGGRAWTHLQARWMLTALLPVCLLAGAQAARLARARRWRTGGLLVSGAAVVAAYGLYAIAAVSATRLLRSGSYVTFAELLTTYRFWLLPGVIILASLLFASAARRAERRVVSAVTP